MTPVPLHPEPQPAPVAGTPGRRSRASFIDRSLADLTATIERDLLAEELASQPGPLQTLDPRAKVLGAAGLVLVGALLTHLALIATLYISVLGLGLAARLPAALLLRRVWLVLPLFTGVVALPAIFSIVTPGLALVTIGQVAGADIAITAPGVRTSLTLLLRVATSVSVVLMLVVTTRWPTLLSALRAIHLPRIFVLLLAMTYRYIFVLAHVANLMFLARKSRTVGPTSGAFARRWLGATTSTLIGKSYHLSTEIYLAMLARGYRGEPTGLDADRMRPADYVALAAALAVGASFLLADRVYAGQW